MEQNLKPYYETKLGKLYHGDCLEIMPELEPVDLVLTDPPYGIGADKAQNNAAKQRIKAKGKSKAGRGWKLYDETNWDLKIPKEIVFQTMFLKAKNSIIFGGNYFTEYLPPKMGWIVWDKGQRNFSLADGELAWTSFDKALRIFTYSRAMALKDGRVHPTQKPVGLFMQILLKYAKAGWTVLDPFAGSGTTGIACERIGNFTYTLIEREEKYCEIIAK